MTIESNVIPTGVGSMPNKVEDPTTVAYYQTAHRATMSHLTDPMKELDRDLVARKSPRLTRLVAVSAVAKEKARFTTKVTPVTAAQTAERATTITIGNTTITPVREAAR
jgi:hypothetical protein